MTTTSMFQSGDLVDVVIRGASFERHSDQHVDVYLPGIDSPVCVPTVDDGGEPLDAVTIGHHVPVVRPGEVWKARDNGVLFMAAQLDDHPPQLIAADQRAYDPQTVVDHWGAIDLIVSSAYLDPSPPEAGPDPAAHLTSIAFVRIGDRLFNSGTWHRVIGMEDPANEGADYRRFYTEHAIRAGLLYAIHEDVWVLPGGDDAPIYATVDPVLPEIGRAHV